jgi:hypothetical protein
MRGGSWRWARWLVVAVLIGCVFASGAVSGPWIATYVLRHVPAVIDSSGAAETASTWESMPTDL